jgi:hypothetical protein
MDNPFDVRMEIGLVREIKDIIEELNIIKTIKDQQESVVEPFRNQMFRSVPKNKQRHMYDPIRLGDHVSVLQRTAGNTFQDVGLRSLPVEALS